jgi:glycogen debranching enzyme
MLAVEHLRWTGDRDLARRLRPAIDRALTWIDTYGDRDGDGFVEYERQTATGLANQGWKDSWDGIRDHRGEVVEAPLALCEVQGYVYTAFGARAYLADLDGEHELARHWRRRASRLQEAFDRAFWVEELGTYAVALDGDKRPVASTTSNVGHCLWTGIVPAHRAGRVADALVSPSMFSGWGIRTLGADNPAFNPLSYHCGSVWPHDTALAVSGLHRYGFHRAAGQVRSGLLDAARAFDGRLPELFAGFGRSELPSPVSYPASCSPQAWAAASPLLLIRAILGLEPDLPGGTVGVRRSLPQGAGALRIGGVALGGVEASITADDRGVSVDGLAGTAAIRWMTDR